jgi:hypothetical protein
LGHLALSPARRHDFGVWRRSEPPALDGETVDGIIRMLMEINAKLDLLLGEDDDHNAGEDES